jgi:ketosteroid isomerase-like protein
MKRLIAAVTVLVVGAVLSPAAMAQDVEEITDATLEHFAALNAGDADAHVQHHLPEVSSFDPDGGLLEVFESREQQSASWQDQFDAGFKFNFELRHLEVKVYGDAAVVTGYVMGTVTSPEGTTEQFTTRRTAVLIKQGGEWKEAHAHSSPLTVALPQ